MGRFDSEPTDFLIWSAFLIGLLLGCCFSAAVLIYFAMH